jgi:hypothetical protein
VIAPVRRRRGSRRLDAATNLSGGVVRNHSVPSRAAFGVPLLALALLAAGCGGSGDDPAAAATTVAATSATTVAAGACADAAALRGSLDRLDRLDPPEAGKAGLQAALDEVRTDLAALRASSGGRWDRQIGELDAAVDGFQATVAGLDGDLLDDLPRIVADLQRIERPLAALERELDQACPSP